jgi:hypothetical protein
MRKVFSSMDISETVLVRDAITRHGIEAFTQNEHAGHAAVPEFRPPVDVWVTHDADYEAARRLVESTLAVIDSKFEAAAWHCADCGTENPASFELCWSCGKGRGDAGA